MIAFFGRTIGRINDDKADAVEIAGLFLSGECIRQARFNLYAFQRGNIFQALQFKILVDGRAFPDA